MFKYLIVCVAAVTIGFAGGYLTRHALESPSGAERYYSAQADELERQKELYNAKIDFDNESAKIAATKDAFDQVGEMDRLRKAYDQQVAQINARFGYHVPGR